LWAKSKVNKGVHADSLDNNPCVYVRANDGSRTVFAKNISRMKFILAGCDPLKILGAVIVAVPVQMVHLIGAWNWLQERRGNKPVDASTNLGFTDEEPDVLVTVTKVLRTKRQ